MGGEDKAREKLVRRVLVITSQPPILAEIQSLIAPTPNSRFFVEGADTLEQALVAISANHHDAIILDLQLEGRNGLDTMKAVHGQANAPIIILTTAGSESLSLQCLEAGAQEYVPREDLDVPTLRRALGYAISRQRADDLRLRLEHSDKLAALGQLTAGVAHEINNPATYVLSNLDQIDELLQSLSKERDDLKLLADMVKDCRSGINLIASISRELKFFARVDDDTMDTIDVEELIVNSSRMTLNEIRYRAIFEQRIAKVPPILGSRSKLSQVLVNLLINAAHSITNGTTTDNRITISADHEGDCVLIRVKDTGVGIAEAALEKIFENYYTTKPHGQGTGLGLPICREIVHQHNGTLDVTSQLGVGTTFTISLPVHKENIAPRPATKVEVSTRRRRVMLIDDEPLLLKSLSRMLQSHHDVVTAIGGATALDLLQEDGDYDVIICDLMMPEVDGQHVHMALRESYPQLVEKIVFLSGGVFTERMSDFLEEQKPKLIDKPVSRANLLKLITSMPARDRDLA
jgi:signal transduction histidine kinase